MKTDESLWAITTYFNPVRYKSRRENFRLFRELLPVPLIAVEYSTDEFELEKGDADILIQLKGTDVFWVKERLYNIARRHLPAHCEQVVWLDCDIAFSGADWPQLVKDALRRHALVQPFRRLALLGPHVRPPHERDDQVIDWRTSLVRFLEQGADPRSVYSAWGTSITLKYAHGIAWAARRTLCDSFDFYDRLITGGGDKVFTAAVFGQHELVAPTFAFEDRYRRDYLQWAAQLHGLVNGSLGHVNATAYHLWHGAISNRGYDNRQVLLHAAGFNAMDDLALDPVTGCWRWATDKPELQAFVRGHFIGRREDG